MYHLSDSTFATLVLRTPGPRGGHRLVDAAGTLLPVEVKAGAAGSLKSLHQYLWRSGSKVGLRLHGGLWSDAPQRVAMPDGDGDLRYRLLSLPLFMAEYVPGIVVAP